jgi:heat shock protein HslJ
MSHAALRTAAFGVLAMVVLAACGSGSAGSSDTSSAAGGGHTPQMSELAGGSWTSDSVSSPDHKLVQGTTIALTFTSDSISVNAGCNNMHGGASISGTSLVVPTLASTMMACDQALSDQDHWVQEFLTSKPTIELLTTDLRLTGGSTKITFVHKQ